MRAYDNTTDEISHPLDDVRCLNDFLSRTTAGFRIYNYIFSVLVILFTLSGLVWWYLRRDAHRLQVRGVATPVVTALGVLCHVFSRSLYNAQSTPSLLVVCEFNNFLYGIMGSLLLFPVLGTVIMTRNRMKLYHEMSRLLDEEREGRREEHQLLRQQEKSSEDQIGTEIGVHPPNIRFNREPSLYFQDPIRPNKKRTDLLDTNVLTGNLLHFERGTNSEAESSRQLFSLGGKMEVFLSNKKLQKLRRQSSQGFETLLYFGFFVFGFTVALLYCIRGCYSFCEDQSFDFQTMMLYLAPVLVCLPLTIVVYRKAKDFPDADGVLREMWLIAKYPMPFAIIASIFPIIDPGNMLERDQVNFIWYGFFLQLNFRSLILNFSPAMLYFIRVHLQVYLSYEPSVDMDGFRLDDIIADRYLCELFEKDLVDHLRAESLYFYMNAKSWVHMYNNISDKKRLKLAESLAKVFIEAESIMWINIAGPARELILKRIKNKNIERDMFDHAIGEIRVLLESQPLVEFKATAAYREYRKIIS